MFKIYKKVSISKKENGIFDHTLINYFSIAIFPWYIVNASSSTYYIINSIEYNMYDAVQPINFTDS